MAKVGDDDGVLVLASSRSLTPIWTVFNCQSIGGYINFMAGDDQDRIDANYRGNYQRLVEVKRKYNPGNLFHLNQNIRP